MMDEGSPPRSDRGANLMLELAKFHEAHRIYETAPDVEKEMHFARRHAALMLVLTSRPKSQDDICEVMRIALDELAKDLMHDGPLPDAVKACLANCLSAVATLEPRPLAPWVQTTPTSTTLSLELDAPPHSLIDMEAELAKLDSFTNLLAYIGRNSAGKVEEGLFFSLKYQVDAIRDSLNAALQKAQKSLRKHP
jgi:hypothetical protein